MQASKGQSGVIQAIKVFKTIRNCSHQQRITTLGVLKDNNDTRCDGNKIRMVHLENNHQ